MGAVFLYGSLCHEPLLQAVMGHLPRMRAAHLPDHAVFWARKQGSGDQAQDQIFPMIVAQQGGQAEGLLLENLSGTTLARMDYYEQAFGYELIPVRVQTDTGPVAAQIYRPPSEGLTPGAPWVLDDWVRDWGALSVAAAQDVMAGQGRRPARLMGARFAQIRARAQARLNAARTAPTRVRRRAQAGDVVVNSVEMPHAGFFSVEAFDLRHTRFEGGLSAPLNREVFVGADAVTVLPYDPVRDRVMLVEQLRSGPLARGDAQPWVLEPIAGRIDPGETPDQAARRETAEEAGLTVGALHSVAQGYSSPGMVSEFLYSFVAIADLPDTAAGLGGLETEGEDIRSHVLSFDAALALLDSGEINVGPTALSLLALSRLRPRLRDQGGASA